MGLLRELYFLQASTVSPVKAHASIRESWRLYQLRELRKGGQLGPLFLTQAFNTIMTEWQFVLSFSAPTGSSENVQGLTEHFSSLIKKCPFLFWFPHSN